MKTIVVTGDLIWDFNLAQYADVPSFHQTLPREVLSLCNGGAWYLQNLVKLACSDRKATVKIIGPKKMGIMISENNHISQAYQIFSLQEQVQGKKEKDKDKEKEKDKVWRISHFWGCQQAAKNPRTPILIGDIPDPDILVLDDLCLGFHNTEKQWPAALRKGGNPKKIVLKTSCTNPTGIFWEKLLGQFAGRTTVILSTQVLRARNASISKALSWDQGIEEIVQEFKTGDSSKDFGRCRRVIIRSDCAGTAVFSRESTKGLHLEHFLYHPDELEGSWKTSRPGVTFGATSILTAAVVRHELQPGSYPIFIALGRGLAAARSNHELGAGKPDGFDPDVAHKKIENIFHPSANPNKKHEEPAGQFCSAFKHSMLDNEILKNQPENESNLLRDITGVNLEYVTAKATEVVIYGPEKALRDVPKARYGRYLTVDREEIERINGIRNLILSYRKNPKDHQPLSLAVFGPPGSGKSFAIKELGTELFGSQKPLEFNLSQIRKDEELYTAFHQVRDASIRGQVPLVFWDEFDTENLRWLKDFLAPMQDANFRAGNVVHPFGKAIFIFAGGTCSTLKEFDKSELEDNIGKEFQEKKGPDFVSRLKGFVNIKGPNPIRPSGCKKATNTPGKKDLSDEESDIAYLIRRAIILRVNLEMDCPQLINPATGEAAINASVVRAFLRVKQFIHGARSIRAIINMSSLSSTKRFGRAQLPSLGQLQMHATQDFMKYIQKGELEIPIIESFAEAFHDVWCKQKEKDGWKPGKPKNNEKKIDHRLIPYQELEEKDKEANRKPARVVNAKLFEIGYHVEQKTGPKNFRFSKAERKKLIRIEHDIWLRDHLINGYDWAYKTKDELRLHRDVILFAKVPPKDQIFDSLIVGSIPKVLNKNGYTLVKMNLSKPPVK